MTLRRATPLLLVLAALAACAADPDIKGTPYGRGWVDQVPNAQAIKPQFWVPGLAARFTPQGLAIAADGDVLVSGFVSKDLTAAKGPCHIYRIARDGAVRGPRVLAYDDPYPGHEHDRCGHAGGLAADRDGTVVLADTQLLFVATGDPVDPTTPLRSLCLDCNTAGNDVRGGAATAREDDHTLWVGNSAQTTVPLYQVALATLRALPDGGKVPTLPASGVQLPADTQGIAFDRDGTLWVSRSDTTWAYLEHYDRTGTTRLGRFPMPAASEGIAFDRDDPTRLWVVSEAGAARFHDTPVLGWLLPFFPVIYTVDVTKLHE